MIHLEGDACDRLHSCHRLSASVVEGTLCRPWITLRSFQLAPCGITRSAKLDINLFIQFRVCTRDKLQVFTRCFPGPAHRSRYHLFAEELCVSGLDNKAHKAESQWPERRWRRSRVGSQSSPSRRPGRCTLRGHLCAFIETYNACSELALIRPIGRVPVCSAGGECVPCDTHCGAITVAQMIGVASSPEFQDYLPPATEYRVRAPG